MCYNFESLTIPLQLLLDQMHSDKTGDHMIRAHHTGRMTGAWNSWLMDTSLWTPELITAENVQQIAGLFSCVNFVISACLTIPDQYSIKEFFAFSYSVASRRKNKKKKKKGPGDEK